MIPLSLTNPVVGKSVDMQIFRYDPETIACREARAAFHGTKLLLMVSSIAS